MPRKIYAADLFCGAGGFSAGLLKAAKEMGFEVELTAINHWDVAIATHAANHPRAKRLQTAIENTDPLTVIPGGRLDLLMASPECVHFSNARGGTPMSDQSRSTAWHVLRWCEALYVKNVIIENVPEFRTWGPLGANRRPLASKKGALFEQFLRSLRALGYSVDHRILNAADFGDATTRKRLFIQARRGEKISWPDPTHSATTSSSETSLFEEMETKPWRPAREIIDWSVPGRSIYSRKKPLSENTMRRILTGLRKYSGLPFIVPNFGEREGQKPRTHSIDDAAPTVTGHGAGCLVHPFLVVLRHHSNGRSLDDPVPTLCAGANHVGLAQPFVVNLSHAGNGDERRSYSQERPVPTTGTSELGLAEPFVLGQQSGSAPRSVAQPIPTVSGKGAISLIAPYLVNMKGRSVGRSADDPIPTVTAGAAHLYLTEPYLMQYHGSHQGRDDGDRRVKSLDEPFSTIDASNRLALTEPFVVKYNRTGSSYSLDEPLDTISTRDRFALVSPEIVDQVDGEVIGYLDIRFRMLQPHELAAAMSFPEDYVFTGTREAQIRQIGNAVPVGLAERLCSRLLG